MFSFCLLYLLLDVVSTAPSYDSSSFLGYSYWNDRCQMGYTDDWIGFWNNHYNGRVVYKRENEYSKPGKCPSGCTCKNGEMDCSKFTGTTLSVQRYSGEAFNVIKNGAFPTQLTTIELINAGITLIEDKVFHDLSNLHTLNLGQNKLKRMPDVSRNTKLQTLILDHNEIEIVMENLTALPESLVDIVLLENKIAFIPESLLNLPNVKRISLSNNKLTKFPSFQNTKHIEFVSVDGNQIEEITSTRMEVFFDSQLKHLNFSNNRITRLPPSTFQNMLHLRILDLHVNKIATIDNRVFYDIAELCYLDLRGNSLETITGVGYTTVFEKLPKLEILVLSDQEPKAKAVMYNAFKDLPALKHLWLDQNALEHFPHPAFSQELWPNIKELHVENNKFSTLSSYSSGDFPPYMMELWASSKGKHQTFSQMKSLAVLAVHINDLKSIEEEDLLELTALKELYLGENSLTEESIHPQAFRNLSLTKLHLEKMKSVGIQYVPNITQEAENLPKIKEIDLSGNKLTYLLNGSFSAITTLEALELSDNRIVTVEKGSFPTSVRTITMSGNRFDFRHPDVFAYLSLNSLYLQNNQISRLPDNALYGLESLRILNIANNKIGRITKESFRDVKSLSSLSAQGNEISFIEEGTFTSINRNPRPSLSINLAANHLTSLPVSGDFHDLSIGTFDVSGNRLTRIHSNTFVNVAASNWFSFQGNDIVEIEQNAFVNITGTSEIKLSGGTIPNPLKRIASGAFTNVKAYNIYLNDLQLKTLNTGIFKDLTLTYYLRLENNQIQTIDELAFDSVKVRYLNLQDNEIQDISSKIFGTGSSVEDIILSRNKIKSLHEDSFKDLIVRDEIVLTSNSLATFPGKALSVLDPSHLDLTDNSISSLPVGSMDKLTKLKYFYVANNKIEKLEKDLFKKSTLLQKVNLRNNVIKEVEEGTFDGLIQLQEINLQNNKISYVPTFNKLPSLKYLYLRENKIKSLGIMAFSNLLNLLNLDLSSNLLACGCNVFNSLLDVIGTMTSPVTCQQPTRVRGVTFPGNYDKVARRGFTCAPINVTASTPTDHQLAVSWTPTPYTYPVEFTNSTNGSLIVKPDGAELLSVDYTITCSGPANQQLVATTNATTYIFKKSDDVRAGTDYTCFVQTMEVTRDGALNNVSLTNRTSVESASVSVTTIEGKAPVDNNTRNASSYYLDITYYDFSMAEKDFLSVSYENVYVDPIYIASPFASWLSISGRPEFSDWFRSESARNLVTPAQVLPLSLTHGKDPKGNLIHRYYSPEFFPVDGQGFGAEGQRDCVTNQLRNFGFAAAARNAFAFSGDEVLTLAGGEELYIFVNKILVAQVFHDPGKTTTPCVVIELANAVKEGGGIVDPKIGVLVDDKCQDTKASGKKTHLGLLVGVTYRLDVFLAERFMCDSKFLFQTSGVSFVDPSQGTEPVDYVTTISEDLHGGAIVQRFRVGDKFHAGGYTVSVSRGNEERRFGVKPGTYQAPAPPASPAENDTVVIVGNKTVTLCKNASNVTRGVVLNYDIEEYDVNTVEALLVLIGSLDYERTKSYDIVLGITHKASGMTGNLTIKVIVSDVNDNCPILPDISYSLKPIPPLVKDAFFTMKATDMDSGRNSEISYIPEKITSWDQVSRAMYQAGDNSTIWVNKTLATTWLYRIYAVDGGTPTRGDYLSVNITVDVTCTEKVHFAINETTGEVFLRAPGMTVSEYPLNSTSKAMCRRCKTGFYCPGDGSELRCGTTSLTEYSFGGASKCEKCPVGWLCHEGIASPCPEDTWVKCNETACPKRCNPCEPGTVCFNGEQMDCLPGSYSDGTGFPCKLCPPGSYNNVSRATTCACCPAGYTSTYRKDGCRACHLREWAPEGTFPTCGTCHTCVTPSQCPCIAVPYPCPKGVVCRNLDYGNYSCGECPLGYHGDGRTCLDIDECILASPCYDNSTCVNLNPGYRCGGCPAGHSGVASSGVGLQQAQTSKQICEDIDECSSGLHKCDVHSKCINTIGSYKCGPCNAGYIGDGYSGCQLGDYCNSNDNDCHDNATCTSRGSGRYTCTCKDGYAGDGETCGKDTDMDGIPDEGLSCLEDRCRKDNCLKVPNEDQSDNDDDSVGDVCDEDDDNDNIMDYKDNCPFVFNVNQIDSDGDGVGDECDNCKTTVNTDQSDIDRDGTGDECDDDIDGDGINNTNDRCPKLNTTNQADGDKDDIGDECDNCPKISNINQVDTDQNGYGDACDKTGNDRDGDGVINDFDNCIDLPNAEQADQDSDGNGDTCDEDIDDDGIANNEDNCQLVANPKQQHNKLIYDQNRIEVGDLCDEDYDGDGVIDTEDTCPNVANLKTTSFEDHFIVQLDGRNEKTRWRVTNKGRDIEQLSNTSTPLLLVGEQRYGPVDFSGTVFVNSHELSNYIGFVFGYQSNRKFYVVMWRHANLNLEKDTYKAGVKGIQLKRVISTSGPSNTLAEALWHSDDTANEVTLLWHDPLMQGWQHNVAYRFTIQHRPSVGKIRLFVEQGEINIVNSGDIYDTALTGGRLGVFVYGQNGVIWSRLRAHCKDRENHALMFDGANDAVLLPTIKELQLTDSFTISAWIKASGLSPVMPVVCTLDFLICLSLRDSFVQGRYGGHVVTSVNEIVNDQWHHITLKFDAQRHELEILLNGTTTKTLVDVAPVEWVNESRIYLAKDKFNFFQGQIDDVSFWPLTLPDSEIQSFAKTAGLSWPKHKGQVRAHYTMDTRFGKTLQDESGNNLDGTFEGNPSWVQSSLDKVRFQLNYPNNRKRRHILHTEL